MSTFTFRLSIAILVLIVSFSCRQHDHDDSSHLKKLLINTEITGKQVFGKEPKEHFVSIDSLKKNHIFSFNQTDNKNSINRIFPKKETTCTPYAIRCGEDSVSKPEEIELTDSTYLAKPPETILAKDPYIKDQNPENFSAIQKLQGLKQINISSITNDKDHNLWLSTIGGGITKYDGKTLYHYTEKEGLKSNDARKILFDKRGCLWIASAEKGILKFDGRKFTTFTNNNELKSGVILCLAEDSFGNIWLGTGLNGLFKLERKFINGKEKFLATHFTAKSGLKYPSILSLYADKSGQIWIGTAGKGITRITQNIRNNKTNYSFLYFSNTPELAQSEVWSIEKDFKNQLWISTAQFGIIKISEIEKNKKFNFSSYLENFSNHNQYVNCIYEDSKNNLWFGSGGGGIAKLKPVENSCYEQSYFNSKSGLTNEFIMCINEDYKKNLWFGTFKSGICKYDGKTIRHMTENEGLSNKFIYSILSDRKNNMWLGTHGGGITVLTLDSTKTLTNTAIFNEENGLSNPDVYCMLQDKEGNYWIGTYGGGLTLLMPENIDKNRYRVYHIGKEHGLGNDYILSSLEDSKGDLWFGTYGDGLTRIKKTGKNIFSIKQYKEKNGLSSNDIWGVSEDKKGNIWLATNGGGITKMENVNQKGFIFTHLTKNEGLSNNSIWNLTVDKSNKIWATTNGNGVCSIEENWENPTKKNTYKINQYSEENGLGHDYVFSSYIDKNENIWFGTRFGISLLSKEKQILQKNNLKNKNELLFKNFSYEDGFLGIGVNGGKTILEDVYGDLWVGSTDRLSIINKNEIVKDTVPPVVQLSSIELFNEVIDWTNWIDRDTLLELKNGMKIEGIKFDSLTKWYNIPINLTLPYTSNFLCFDFVGISLHQAKKIKYSYKLEGIDENWSAISSRTSASYGNLPSGNYTFFIKAMNSDGFWSETFSYSFSIDPPWWKTWWFRLFSFLGLLLGVFAYIKYREQKLIRKQKELKIKITRATREIVQQKQLIELKHKEIKDSINYAERIQRSLLSTEKQLNENLNREKNANNYFIFFKPKDVVSGDFYWSTELPNKCFVLCTADSTGHGVPGAIMSILNIACLKESIKENLTNPSDILNNTRKLIIETLKKDGSAEGGKDGMDCSLCVFDFSKMKMLVSASYNPVWIIRKNKVEGIEICQKDLIEIKADKMPVGKHDKEHLSFSTNEVELKAGDLIYSFTDGFPDQFGGPKGKKFKLIQLKELLLSVSELPMDQQAIKIDEAFKIWKGDLDQIDDVTLIGIRI